MPVVYNSHGYERVEVLDCLGDAIDVFLPDVKYGDAGKARRYAQAPDYFSVAAKAVARMVEIVGEPKFGAQGILRKGVLVRHLVLPGCRKESMRILDWLWENWGNGICLSLMRQYTPMYRTGEYPEIDRRLTSFEYDFVVEHARELGFMQCYIQEKGAASEAFVPKFDGRGVKGQLF